MRLKYKLKREYWYNVQEDQYNAKITLLLPTEDNTDRLHPLLLSYYEVCGKSLTEDYGELYTDGNRTYRMASVMFGAVSPEVLKCEVENEIQLIYTILREIVHRNYRIKAELPPNDVNEYGIAYGEEDSI